MSDEEFSIEAKADGVSMKATGESSHRLANQFADLISPFTEGFGAVGDHFRVLRQKSVMKALQHAHNEADQNGIELRPVAPKFLVRWTENASLEDDDDLSKKWGNLLLSSMGEFDATSVWAANILSELGTKEVQLLDDLYQRSNIRNVGTIDQKYNWYWQSINTQLKHIFEDIVAGISDADDISKIRDSIKSHYLENNQYKHSTALLLGVHWMKSSRSNLSFAMEYTNESALIMEIHISKGLLQRSAYRGNPDDIFKMPGAGHIDYIMLTMSGLKFLDLVSPIYDQ